MTEFQTSVAAEKDRLIKHRAQLTTQVTELEGAIASVDHELHAITVYETTRNGKVPRGTKRDTILAIIREHQPIARAAIADKLDDDKGLSNTLNVLKKAGKITADEGKYALASSI